MHVLVTGGLGYIGSHTVIELCSSGHTVTILDDCSNSSIDMLNALRTLTKQSIQYFQVDCTQSLDELCPCLEPIDAIIHFAAYKYVGESAREPHKYYYNNIVSLLNMLKFATAMKCKTFIFSSSATVYPSSVRPPFRENDAGPGNMRYNTMIAGNNPYGTSKIMCEQILHDIAAADPSWQILCLRYFNPVGNHSSGNIGDTVKGSQYNNLFPAILGAVQAGQPVQVFGGDYNTCDGTAVRDYIHVSDLAEAHVRGLNHMKTQNGIVCMNIGCGQGHSVLEIIKEFQQQGLPLKYNIASRRVGDADIVFADTQFMERALGWKPTRSLQTMVQDTLAFFNSQKNISG
jgi:UDP-glucose 4-epimerase